MSTAARDTRVYKTMTEALALCDLNRAKRTEPAKPLAKMTPAEQAAFWRKQPALKHDTRR